MKNVIKALDIKLEEGMLILTLEDGEQKKINPLHVLGSKQIHSDPPKTIITNDPSLVGRNLYQYELEGIVDVNALKLEGIGERGRLAAQSFLKLSEAKE